MRMAPLLRGTPHRRCLKGAGSWMLRWVLQWSVQ